MARTGAATLTGAPGNLLENYPWARQWQGEWIGPRPVASTKDRMATGARNAPFSRHLYRSTLTIDSLPETAPLRLTADSRYVLYVNGEEVGRGPVRSQPRKLHYDTYDVASLLREGSNQVVVLVTYFGSANSFWQPAVGTGNFGSVGVLALEMQLGHRWFVSGDDWEVEPATAWSEPPRKGFAGGVPVEVFDARLLEPEWKEGTAGNWSAAHVQPVVHLSGLGATRPPTDPFGALLPRPIGACGGEEVAPVAASIGNSMPPAAMAEDPIDNVRTHWHGLTSTMGPAQPGEVSFVATGPATRAASFDFGRIVAGHTAFTLDAPSGTTIDILYREAADTTPEAAGHHAPRTGARYIARGIGDTFVAQEINGLRWISMIITVPAAGTVRLSELRVREYLSQPTGNSYFRSSDPELDKLYLAGVRTVALNSLDAYVDCPTREQRSWVGDAVVHQMVNLTTSDDWRLPHWYIELANSPRPDGILPMSVVGDLEHGQGFTIPEWSLYWIHGLHNIYRYSADRATLTAATPTARRILEWFVPYLTDAGVLANLPEWTLTDWSSIFLNGKSSIHTAFWAAELREYAEIAEFLGNAGEASWAHAMHAKIRAGYEAFWDEKRGTYIDHIVDEEPQPAASQIAGALAIISGLAPSHRTARIIDWISDPARHVTRSWIGGNGTYDEEKIARQIKGDRQVDWNPETQSVVAQPFASFLVHDAYAEAGRPDLVLGSIRRWSTFLQDGWDTFGECWGWGTPAHGWSSTPTRDLIQHIAGVNPAEPGFTRAKISPAYGAIDRLEASTPTPYGNIEISVADNHAIVTSPVPFTLFDVDGRATNYPPGQA